MNTVHAKGNVLNKIGIPSHMVWGYMGVVIFMVGDGLEQGWLSPFLVDHGLSMQQSASLFTMYALLSPSRLGFQERLCKRGGREKR